LAAATDFALAALRLETRGGVWEAGAHGNGLRQVVQLFIVGNLHREDLNLDMLARTLYCSRTHLYRLFAGNGGTVMGTCARRVLRAAGQCSPTPPAV
jgi:AraC-like DNA-binding protein